MVPLLVVLRLRPRFLLLLLLLLLPLEVSGGALRDPSSLRRLFVLSLLYPLLSSGVDAEHRSTWSSPMHEPLKLKGLSSANLRLTWMLSSVISLSSFWPSLI